MDARVTRPKAAPHAGRAKASLALLVWARKLHLYSGVLFAPAILFFALTGLIQVFDLHKAQPAAGYQPAGAILRLAALHKDQTFALPHKADAVGGARPAPRGPKPIGWAQALLKGFAAAVAVGLGITTCLGVYMAYRFNRNRWLIWTLLAAGIAVPLMLVASVPGAP
jgi:hypothetical protein